MTMVMEDGRYTRSLIAYRIRDASGPIEIIKRGYALRGLSSDDLYFLLDGNTMYVLMDNGMKQPLSGTSVNHLPSQNLLMTQFGAPFKEHEYGLISLQWQDWSRAYKNIGTFWQGQGGRSIYIVDTAIYPWYRLLYKYSSQESKDEKSEPVRL